MLWCTKSASPKLETASRTQDPESPHVLVQGEYPPPGWCPVGSDQLVGFQRPSQRFEPWNTGTCRLHMGVEPKIGVFLPPQIIHFNRVWNHCKPSILGVFTLSLVQHPICLHRVCHISGVLRKSRGGSRRSSQWFEPTGDIV